MNRKQRRANKKHNNQELRQIIEKQVREIYYLKQEIRQLKKLHAWDAVDPVTGEVTRQAHAEA